MLTEEVANSGPQEVNGDVHLQGVGQRNGQSVHQLDAFVQGLIWQREGNTGADVIAVLEVAKEAHGTVEDDDANYGQVDDPAGLAKVSSLLH